MQRAIRRFSLLDAMILIAATGFGITAIQAIVRQMRVTQIDFDSYSIWLILASPLVGMWCLALLVSALTGRGVRRRRLFRLPGVTASCTIWIVFLGVNWGFVRLNPTVLTPPDPSAIFILWDQAAYAAGLSIVAVWVMQALAGCWRPAPHWIDRAGRLSGCFWIIAYIIKTLNV